MLKSSEKSVFFFYLLGAVGLVYSLIVGLPTAVWVASFAWIGFCTACLNEAFLHRYLTHKSFRLAEWKVKVLSVFTTVTLAMGSPMGWAALHRAHHRYADASKDPHSPKVSSLLELISFRFNYTGTMHSSADFITDKFQVALHRYYVPMTLVWALIVYLLSNVEWLLGLVVIPWFINVLLTGLVAYFGHTANRFTTTPYNAGSEAVNSFATWLVSYGASGAHNTHHTKPWEWDTREHWYDIDTAAWFIKLVKERD